MKALDLDQAITFFDPERPLLGSDLRMWYVPRPETPRGYLRRVLLNSQRTKKTIQFLFVGHRGSGKSTELNKLAVELEGKFVTVPLDLFEIVGSVNPTYEDLMLALSTQIVRFCIEENLIARPVGDKLRQSWREVGDWWLRLVSGLEVRPPSGEVETFAELGTLLGQISLGARRSAFTHDQIIAQIHRQMSELIRRLNFAIEEAQAHLNPQRLLILVEGLDKVNLTAARHIFRDNAKAVTSLDADVVFTYPIALRHSEDFRTVLSFFSDHQFLQNIGIFHPNGENAAEGQAALRRLVLARLEERLIEPEALQRVVMASGGILTDLVKLIRSAAIYALVRDDHAQQILPG